MILLLALQNYKLAVKTCVEFSLLKSIDFIVINVRVNEKLQAVKLEIREINQCLNCVYQVKVITHKLHGDLSFS